MAVTSEVVRSLTETLHRTMEQVDDLKEKRRIIRAFRDSLARGSVNEVLKLSLLKRTPVTVRTFIEDKDYLDMKGEVYPAIMEEIEELNSGKYIEAILTGAIGTGKTTIALITQAYQLYQLSCYANPHALYNLAKSSEILFIFQNLTEKLAKAVDYERFKAMIEKSPYFKEKFPFDKYVLSEMKFPNRISVKPVAGTDTSAIGQNVFGGLIDEVNFMEVVEKSKRSIDGGTYDQAVALYNTIARRRKSRFMQQGKLPGILCLVSSKKYPGQFTDMREEAARKEIAETGTTSIFIYDKRTWDVMPADRFSGKWFKVFVGDEYRKPRILDENDVIDPKDRHLIVDVPEEYKEDFETDMMGALRDIAGVATLAKHPFIMDREAVAKAFDCHPSILSTTEVDFEKTKLLIYPKRFYKPDLPRWAHIDLAVSGDSAGLAIGCVPQFVDISRGGKLHERLPVIRLDCSLEIQPPKGGEIKFYKIRELLYKLREFGLNIKWVSFDSFQSTDSMQILRRQGFTTGLVSMDTTTAPYEFLKTTIYDGRLRAPMHKKAITELESLELDTKRNKIDHPPRGSKDVSDAIAGVVHGLTTRKEIWLQHGVPLRDIPETVQRIVVKVPE